MDVAVNTGLLSGFSSRPRTLAGLDPARPDRLVLRTAFRWVPGAVVLTGLLVLAWFFGDVVPPLVLAVPAAAAGVRFGLRRWAILDRSAGTLRQGWGLLFPWRLAATPLTGVRAVTLERVEELAHRGKGGSQYVTRYWAGLFDDNRSAGWRSRPTGRTPSPSLKRWPGSWTCRSTTGPRTPSAGRRISTAAWARRPGRGPHLRPAGRAPSATGWRIGPTARSSSGSPSPAITPISPSAA